MTRSREPVCKTDSAYLILCFCCVAAFLMGTPAVSEGGPGYEGTDNKQATTSVNNQCLGDNCGFARGIDPAVACTDQNLDGQISSDECTGRDWSWTASDPQIPAAVNNQNGAGVTSGSSQASVGQTSDQTVSSGPHLTVRYYNSPAKPDTTATSGFTSTSNGSSRSNQNEYGFEIIVDKKTDPLEPYYQRFAIPYTTVDSQTGSDGNLVGPATVTYEKVVTEMDPSAPGVFNRYTVTGTATSNWNGTTGQMEGSYSSTCQSGCPQDANGFSYDPETGWTHPWQ